MTKIFEGDVLGRELDSVHPGMVIKSIRDNEGFITDAHRFAGNIELVLDDNVPEEKRIDFERYFVSERERQLKKAKLEKHTTTEIFGADFDTFLEALQRSFADEYKKLGIRRLFFPPMLVSIDDSERSDHFNPHSCHINLRAMEVVQDFDFRSITAAKISVHEVTHSVGVIKYRMSKDLQKKEGAYSYQIEQCGAGKLVTTKYGEGAGCILEEGVACMSEVQKHAMLAQQFGESFEIYQSLIQDELIEMDYLPGGYFDNKEFYLATSRMTAYSEGEYEDRVCDVGVSAYLYPYKIAKALARVIPSFDKLLAQSRIFGDDSLLRKAVSDYFNEDLYNKITTMHSEDSAAVWDEFWRVGLDKYGLDL